MDKLREDILNLCQHYPQGLPLLKIPLLYRAMYKKPLDLGPDGFLEGFLEAMADDLTLECTQAGVAVRPAQFHPPHCDSAQPSPHRYHPAQVPVEAPPVVPTKDCNKEAVLQQLQVEILYLLRCTPGGVELPKLCSKYRKLYGRKLTLSHYGLGGLQELLVLLGDQVCMEHVNNKNVLKEASQRNCSQHLTDNGPSASGPGCSPSPKKMGKKVEKASLEVLELLKQHPEGIPIKNLANAFNKKYQKKLKISKLGFSSVALFVESLGDEVLIDQEVVFHRSHIPPGGRTRTPELPKPPCGVPVGALVGFPVIAPVGSVQVGNGSAVLSSSGRPSLLSKSVEDKKELTDTELWNNVTEVCKIYPPARMSVEQLQNGYFLHFHTPLPLERYKSLYDNHTWIQKQMAAAPANTCGPMVCPGLPALRAESPAGAQNGKVQLAGVTNGDVNAVVGAPVGPLVPAALTPALPRGLSGADFPALGTKLSKGEEKKLKQSPAGNAPLFREGYYAQVRETHRAAMQDADVLESEAESRDWRKSRVSVEEANSLAENVIRAIAADGEQVTVEKVCSRLCRIKKVQSLQSVGIDPRRQLSAIKDFLRTIKEVNLYIQSVEAVQTVCTLYELGQCLASLKNMKRFEELNLGPLCKIPLVHKMFQVDCNTKDDDITQIETVDIIRSLRDYKRKQRAERVDLADFLKYLADQYNCESPYNLGVRINSIGLAISTLHKAVRSEHTAMDKAKDIIQMEIEEEVKSKMMKIKRSILEAAQGPAPSSAASVDLRRKYASLTAAEVVMEVFTHAEEVFSTRLAKHVREFLTRVTGDRLATALFQLAICGGSLEVPQDLVAKEKAHKPTQEKNKGEQKCTAPPPSEAAVKQYLQDSMASVIGVLSLPYMSGLEKKVSEHFRVSQFSQLEQGNFLEFLVKPGISPILQEAGGGTLALGSQDSQACGFRPSRQDVFEFIKQCGVEGQDRVPFIESALRSHYRIRDSRELGFGALSTLVGHVVRQKQLNAPFSTSLVRYESPLFVKDSRGSVDEKVGLLGPVTREDAVASLVSAPLLEDLAEWAEWELVFERQHGPLKDFMERHCGAQSDLAALEVRPGVLLRISTSSNDKLFSEAAQDLDPVGTAGHLVSIVVADGIANAPAALLANHMESSLAPAVTQEDLSVTEDPARYTRVAKFILDCLIRIPARICKAFLQQVFLEPLSRVLGQAKSKAVLLQTAKSDTRYLNQLHHLGLLLGMTEWVKDFQTKLSPPKLPAVPSLIKKPQSADSMSMSSRSSAVDLDEDLLEESRPEPDFNSETSSLSFTDQDDDEGQKFELVRNAEGCVDGEMADDDSKDVRGEQLQKEGPDGAEPTANEAEDRLSKCRAVINDIRKSEFGIGVELNEEGQKLMKVHQERLGRSLERLSAELYSKDTHFVLELIQNADDNSYPLAGDVQPALAFVLEKDCITILNNESGFEEKNIRAICDVGRSTKGKHKYGYIGQKGIGFKSVFKVTDCPEINSNGFHICFDKNSGPMGYILPHWLEEERPVCTDLLELKQHSWSTKISLPLRSESYQTRNLFHDVHPSLLLFLHRLRSITIVNQNDKRQVSMTRRDLSHNILEVQHTDGVERWLVVKRMLSPRMIKEGVESTELALAFKLTDSTSEMNIQPEKQPVFAFLPLRSFGFRFIIQGDFDIPSSREDVDRDSYWNQWLRSEIPQLFLHAMDTFAEHPEFSGLQGLCHFLQFIPLPDEILDFFNPVAGQIIQLLKGKACLPTKEREDGSVEYKLPSQIAVSQDPLIQEVIGPEHLHRHLNLSYLHPALQSALPPSLVSALGVHRLRAADVAVVTCAMAKELIDSDGNLSDSCLKKVAKLLVCNFRALEQEYSEADTILKALKDIPIIPLADGRKVALSEGGIFFPLLDENKSQSGIEALYKDLSIVAPGLLECLDPLGNSQVRELLKRLEVHQLEPQEVLHNHIYPALKSGDWKRRPNDIIISYVVFIKQNSRDQDYNTLNTAIPVLTNKGFLCPSQSKVQFSKDYGNIDLPKKLPGVEWVLLDPCYLKAHRDPQGWREFFSALGVQDLLIFKKEKRTMSSEQLASSPWAADCARWPRPADGLYVVEDHECEEFRSLVTADQLPDQLKREQRLELLKLLDQNWVTGDRYSQYVNAQVLGGEGRNLISKSSFFHFLTSLPWVPAERIEPGNFDKSSVEYLRPSAVHLYSPELYKQLGIHVSYVKMDPSEFSNTVGMKHSITVEEMIAHLKSWCTEASESCPPTEDRKDFITTVEHVHNVYNYLYRDCSPVKLKDLFQQTAAVFIEFERKEQWCSGRFYMLKEVCWSDPTGMFMRYKDLVRKSGGEVQEPKLLAPFYSQLEYMKDFFLKILGVDPHPSMKQYVDLLELICASSSLPNTALLQDVNAIYAKLAEKCKTQSGEQEQDAQLIHNYCISLKTMLTDKKVFPTMDNRWVTLSLRPLIPDDKNLENIFKPYREVCLLNLPKAAKGPLHKSNFNPGKRMMGEKQVAFNESDRDLFLKICEVKTLSQCVTTEALTENYRPCQPLQALFHKVVPYVQKFLCHHEELGYIYNELKENHIAQLVKSLSFGQVGKLYRVYRMNLSDEQSITEQKNVICLLKDNKEFYIQKDHLTAKLDISREMAKLFITDSKYGKELQIFLLELLTSLDDKDALKSFLRENDIKDLPDSEEKWEVPEPLEMKPELPVFSGFQFSRSTSVAGEERREEQGDGERTLASWPPNSSFHKTQGGHTAQAVEAVMKMWPPPAPPAPADRETTPGLGCDGRAEDSQRREQGHAYPQGSKPSGNTPPSADKNHETGTRMAQYSDTMSLEANESCGAVAKSDVTKPEERKSEAGRPDTNSHYQYQHAENTVAPEHQTPRSSHPPNHKEAAVPDVVVSNSFQGNGIVPRPPLVLDNPVWAKQLPPQAVLEDLVLDCWRPKTVVFAEDKEDTGSIGEWGEQLVNAFFTHWKESGSPDGPREVTWYNSSGESGQPCDFKIVFAADGQGMDGCHEVFVEVKSTVKPDKHFIHLSANELDLALKEKERYHIYRVYNAGDSQNVRLCRIKNVAQHLHSKELELFLFV
ncbi:protein NO VEIN isoform X1 [Anguilla anguilla]|uniref:protein NO VEIN isoform X1 n=1 Tax=Anguilla anguilla TaxID=7936 RepID=UPI0015A87F7E|nr:protein NO VEIN isoform X1 [Anguilla anguilla]XP_035259284.1 protein NO VEIN isoform X1 [Anguilla anguilla]XP_035259286.1 protein NO VEIN isoform X1 [Anguilla anguilla]